MADSALNNPSNASTDSYYYLPYTLPVHLPGLVSTNPADSPHMPLPQKALPPEVPGFTDVQPERVGTDFGMDTSFKYIPNDYEVLKDCALMVRLAPLAASGTGAAPMYPEDVLLHAIDYYRFEIGGVVIQQRWGEEIHFNELVEDNQDEFARKDAAQGINIGTGLNEPGTGIDPAVSADPGRSQRASKTWNSGMFANGQWFMLDMPFWWSETAAKHWHQYACQRQTRITIHWRNPEYILQQVGDSTIPQPDGFSTYILDCFLRFRVSSLDTTVKNTYIDAVKSQGANGINYLIEYVQRQENQVVEAGKRSVNIQLLNFNKPTYKLRFVVRKASNLAANPQKNNRWATEPIESYEVKASGHTIWPLMNSFYAKYMVNGKEFLNNPNHDVFHVLHTDYADVTQYPMGCIEYAKLNNPVLTINFPAALSESCVVDVYAYCYDYVRLVISSDNRSAVALEQPI